MFENYYKMLLDFKGYQNPGANLWFIGREEHWKLDKYLDFNERNDIGKINLLEEDFKGYSDEYYQCTENDFKQSFMKNDDNKKYFHRTFYKGILDILKIIFGDAFNDIDFQKKIVLGENDRKPSKIFWSNIFPIGKERDDSLSVNGFVNSIFNIELQKYYNDEEKRIKKLSEIWQKNIPLHTFVLMGWNERGLYKKINTLFNIDYYAKKTESECLDDFLVKVRTPEKVQNIFFLNHPSGNKWNQGLDFIKVNL